MKKKSLVLLFTAGCMALLSTARAATVWRNQGVCSCYSLNGSNAQQAAIYIGGDLQFVNGRDANNASLTPSLSIESSRVLLTGDLLNDVTKGTTGGNLFIPPSSGNNGVLEFNGTSPQAITTSGTNNTSIPSKLYNYIDFPNIEINNPNHVTLDARLAAKTQDVTLNSGWLVLDSKLAQKGIDGSNTEINEAQESVLAHLLVEGNIDYKENTWNTKPANERGFIQVNLKIPNEGNLKEKSIVGMGIPFNEIRNDYFMFNTLLEPAAGYTNGEGFLANPPLIDPTTKMTAGKGYVVGIDLRGTDPEEYGALEDYEGIIDFNQRAKEGYEFNRHAFASDALRNKNQLFGSDPTTDAYTKEKLNTEDITVTLQPGYNYLANPYTCPLNIDKLLGNDDARATWNIQADALSAKPQMRNQVWVLNPNSTAELTGDSRYSRYTYNYYVAMKTGGTYTENDGVTGITSIAPLQMFLIRSYSTATTITIPKSERVMGTTRFLRSSAKEDKRRDDFIIEFRDMQTNTSDRASIVLREEEELLNNKNYANVERLESTSVENSNGTRSGNATTENATIKNTTTNTKADFEQSLASQIYTKDNAGKPLTVQFLPVETEKITLYHIPSSQAQPLHILGLRLNTKDKVTRMWLEDHKYNTETEITPETLYETYSEPTDSHERFVIRFSREVTSIEDEQSETSNIYAYSENRTIYAQGFTDVDFGSKVELYDINGRILASRTADSEKVTLLENVTSGVYIVKVNTQKPKTIKIMAR